MSALAPTPTPARWLVTASLGGSRRRYLLYQSVDFNQARPQGQRHASLREATLGTPAKADAQLWLGALRPDQLWLVSLHTLAEGR